MNIRRIQIASPLSLLVLSACGGGSSSVGGALSALINGTAINGPLFGARVFLDVADANGDFNGDGKVSTFEVTSEKPDVFIRNENE